MSKEMITIKYGEEKIAEIHEISLRLNFCYGALITLESQVINEDQLRKILREVSRHRRKIKKMSSLPSLAKEEKDE